MPAPTPITIRYGNDGLLGAAASNVGYNSGLLALADRRRQQEARDMAFLDSEFNRRQQQDQFNQSLEFQKEQANRLQQANQLSLTRQTGASTDPNYFAKSSPLVSAVTEAKLARLKSIVGDSGVDTSAYESQLQNPQTPADLVFQSAESDAKRAQAQRSTAAKRNILREAAAAGGRLPPEQAAVLEAAVNDETTKPDEFRVALVQAQARQGAGEVAARKQSEVETRARTTLQLNDLDNQAKSISATIRLMLSKNPDLLTANPAQFNPKPGLQGGVLSRAAQAAGDRLVPGYSAEYQSAGDQQGLQEYTVFAQLQRQLQDIQQRREELVGGATGAPAAGAARPVGQLSNEELLRELTK